MNAQMADTQSRQKATEGAPTRFRGEEDATTDQPPVTEGGDATTDQPPAEGGGDATTDQPPAMEGGDATIDQSPAEVPADSAIESGADGEPESDVPVEDAPTSEETPTDEVQPGQVSDETAGGEVPGETPAEEEGEEVITDLPPDAPYPEYDPSGMSAGYDEFLRPRKLVDDPQPIIITPVIDSNTELVLPEIKQDDGPMSKDTRTDIVYRKTITNDAALQNFLQCNHSGPDLLQLAFGLGTPYLHVLVRRPLTVKEIRRLDDLVSYYRDPDPEEYYIVYTKDNYAQYTREMSGTQESLLTAMIQPRATKPETTIIGVAFYVEYWREGDPAFAGQDAGIAIRVFDYNHKVDVVTRHFDLPKPSVKADPTYKKVTITGLGGKVNASHEHVWRIFVTCDDSDIRIRSIATQLIIGYKSTVQMPQL
ncbi:hypothetical protein HDV00_007145 [Rhizophlyctis rosea]|nr:hypothetical protein HDV00_007145 [Rhizophlyctis rosea]